MTFRAFALISVAILNKRLLTSASDAIGHHIIWTPFTRPFQAWSSEESCVAAFYTSSWGAIARSIEIPGWADTYSIWSRDEASGTLAVGVVPNCDLVVTAICTIPWPPGRCRQIFVNSALSTGSYLISGSWVRVIMAVWTFTFVSVHQQC